MNGEDNAGIRIPPPFIFLGVFLVGLVLRGISPFEFSSRLAGVLLLASAAALGGWALLVMWQARTGILPHHPASALVTWGPFEYTRNPLYVSLTLAYASAAVWTGAMTSLLLLPVALLILQRYVIRREEAYLTRRFGDHYRRYCARVGRWLGAP